MHALAQITRAKIMEVALHGVYETTKLLAASAYPRGSLPELLNLLCNFFELSHAAIALGDDDANLALIGPGRADAQLGPRMQTLVREAARRVRLTPVPWVLETHWTEAASLRYDDHELDQSFIAVPIKDRGRVRGVLCVARFHSCGDQADFCFDQDVRFLTMIANAIAASDRASWVPPSGTTTQSEQASETTTQTAPEAPRVIGDNPRWTGALNRARAAARSSSTVLLRGESGTGKEILAGVVHGASPRHERPFVTVNCAVLSEQLLESELFGHEKGAFTGAFARRKGRFELAHGGTLFLDEIGEISSGFQARLLRVLQLGEFERVGGTSTIKVDVRVIAATNRNLEQDVRDGRFRADLYYRINVVPVIVPPLRERASDIEPLAREFLQRFNAQNQLALTFHSSAIAALLAYSFPGNVRELENSVYRAATLATGRVLTCEDFSWLRQPTPLTGPLAGAQRPASSPTYSSGHGEQPEGSDGRPQVAGEGGGLHEGAESDTARERLIAALEQAGWVQAKAARLLGLTSRQVAYALAKHGVTPRKF
jgi:Nif-specific regulatory protein